MIWCWFLWGRYFSLFTSGQLRARSIIWGKDTMQLLSAMVLRGNLSLKRVTKEGWMNNKKV